MFVRADNICYTVSTMTKRGFQMECLNYPIYLKEGFEGLKDAFDAAGLAGGKVCVIADRSVAALYLDEVRDLLSAEAFVFAPGEESKNLNTISEIYEFFLKSRADRRTAAVALGGGVTGDMAGFAAATFMRGIPYVQVPTTLLSQVDSSVGGKTGVDFHGHKNMIGTFTQPAFVYINIKTLDTLPPEQFASGMGEVIKHGLIADVGYFNMLEREKAAIKNIEKNALLETVCGSCQIKASVVSVDEKERGLREILNFGHTFGHAIESLSRFTLLHGQCVALGITAASYLSYRRGSINEEELESIRQLLEFFDLPVKVNGYGAGDILAQMAFDKKSKGGSIRLVLLDAVGKAAPNQTASDGEILDAIKYITD